MLRSRYSRLTVWALGLTGLLFSAGTAKAEFFEYTSTVSISTAPGSYDPSNATIVNNAGGKTSSFASDNNTLALLAQDSIPAIPHLNGVIGTDIAPLAIDANSGIGTVNDTVAFDFSLTVNLTNYDTATSVVSNGTGSVTFTGRLGGNLGAGAVNIDLLSFAGAPQNVTIGDAVYTVDFKNYASPGLDHNGTLSLHVSTRAVPEPASFALIGLGMVGAFGVYRRRNRATA